MTGGSLDVLVANAGVLPMKDLKNTTEADWDSTFALNVKGPYFLAQVRNALYSGFAHIIEFSSQNLWISIKEFEKRIREFGRSNPRALNTPPYRPSWIVLSALSMPSPLPRKNSDE